MSEHGPKSPTTRHILHALSAHMDLSGGSCFPSMRTLAEKTRLSLRCVHEHIDMAAKAGWIKKDNRTSVRFKKMGKNHYQAVVPKKIYQLLTEGKQEEKTVNPDTEPLTEGKQPVYPGCTELLTEGKPISSVNFSLNSSDESPAQNPSGGGLSEDEIYVPTKEEVEKLRATIKAGSSKHQPGANANRKKRLAKLQKQK